MRLPIDTNFIFFKLEEEIEKIGVEKQYFQTKCDENEQLIQFLETQIKVYTNENRLENIGDNGMRNKNDCLEQQIKNLKYSNIFDFFKKKNFF